MFQIEGEVISKELIAKVVQIFFLPSYNWFIVFQLYFEKNVVLDKTN
jgi:hypothetical protein